MSTQMKHVLFLLRHSDTSFLLETKAIIHAAIRAANTDSIRIGVGRHLHVFIS